MAAALLAPGRTTVRNVPKILDVDVMGQLLEQLGCAVTIEHPADADPTRETTAGTVTIDVPEDLVPEAPYDLVRRLRASISVLGPLVARCRRASVALPGGDAIGSRGLDMHVRGLRGARCRGPDRARPGGRRGARQATRREPLAGLPVAWAPPRTC